MTRSTFVLRRKSGGVAPWAVRDRPACGGCPASFAARGPAIKHDPPSPLHPRKACPHARRRSSSSARSQRRATSRDWARRLNGGLDAGLSVNEAKEVLVQVYAYAGFPRSLNALGELMKVLEARQAARHPGSAPDESRAARSRPARRCSPPAPPTRPGSRVHRCVGRCSSSRRPSTATSRRTCSATSSSATTSTGRAASSPPWACCPPLPGAESQLQAHMRISLNVGLTQSQLRRLAQVLDNRVGADNAQRARESLDRALAATPARGS